jgi:hypothetical protein
LALIFSRRRTKEFPSAYSLGEINILLKDFTIELEEKDATEDSMLKADNPVNNTPLPVKRGFIQLGNKETITLTVDDEHAVSQLKEARTPMPDNESLLESSYDTSNDDAQDEEQKILPDSEKEKEITFSALESKWSYEVPMETIVDKKKIYEVIINIEGQWKLTLKFDIDVTRNKLSGLLGYIMSKKTTTTTDEVMSKIFEGSEEVEKKEKSIKEHMDDGLKSVGNFFSKINPFGTKKRFHRKH